jgi:short-subunit dehydrogenase
MHVAITGASSGIGEALAREYLARGHAVTLVARRLDRLQAIAREAGGTTHLVAADLSVAGHATDWIDSAETALGPIDVLVNNAGASLVQPTASAIWEPAETLFRLNVLAPFRLTLTLLPRMLARKSGCIVDIASVAALAGAPGFFFYNASKAALAGASESLRSELRGTGVHVVTVYPGPVHTPMGDANFAAVERTFAPTGNSRTLARLIVRAVERRKARVIYPRVYTVARWFPVLGRFIADHFSPRVTRPRNVLEFGAKTDQ